jgi:hypothetical protein
VSVKGGAEGPASELSLLAWWSDFKRRMGQLVLQNELHPPCGLPRLGLFSASP